MRYKAIIFDLDGTAIDSPKQKQPSPRLINAIRAVEKDYFVCAATGRVLPFAGPVLQAMSLVDPCIISGGTQICDPENGKIIWQMFIDPHDVQVAISIIKQYPNYKTLYNEYDEYDYLHGGIDPKDLNIDGPTYLLEQKFVPENIAPEIVSKLSAIEGIACTLVVAQRPGYNDIHITNKYATKEHAVAELVKILGIKPENTIGIGDGHNDIHLFNAVARKVAMGNAVSDLKSRADEVIDSVNNDGLAAFLEQIAKS